MLILAFESSAKAASVALLNEGGLLAESYQNTGLTHSQTLLKMAQDLLENAGKAPSDVTAVAVSSGPGSFTGVRIGVAAAKGFAWGGQKPCYGVSTLEAMALGAASADGIYCAAMDARRSQVYNGVFRMSGGELTRLREDRAISLQELQADLLTMDGPIYLIGDGAKLCMDALGEKVPGMVLLPEQLRQQRASGVALCARKMMDSGLPGDGAALVPNYLRLSQAERERLEKEKTQNENR